jgi:hypothetical protein
LDADAQIVLTYNGNSGGADCGLTMPLYSRGTGDE